MVKYSSYWSAVVECKVGSSSATHRRGTGAGVLALGVELLPLPVNAGCVVEVTIEAGVFGITAKSVWASKEIGGHLVNIGGLDLK